MASLSEDMRLVSKYTDRLNTADQFYKADHSNVGLSDSKKIMLARVMENLNTHIHEGYAGGVGTQRANMGSFKKFCMDISNVVLPNLISEDLVLVRPADSYSGFVSFIKYTAGSTKGGTTQGDVFFDPWGNYHVDSKYTSRDIESGFTLEEETDTFDLSKWSPVMPGSAKLVVVNEDGTEDTYLDDGAGNIVKNPTSYAYVASTPIGEGRRIEGDTMDALIPNIVGGEIVGTIVYAKTADATPAITLNTGVTGKATLTYVYNNQQVPANNLPLLNAQRVGIPVEIKERSIATNYSILAQFQSEKDFGTALGSDLANMATAEVQYEIDTEIIDLLVNAAKEDESLLWSYTEHVGVNLQDTYNSFGATITRGSMILYKRTKRFHATYALISPDMVEIFLYLNGFTAAPATTACGPYFFGTWNNISIYVTPNMDERTFVLGVKGPNDDTAAAVYMPYMPIFPTGELHLPDGGVAQGYHTAYGLAVLDADLLVKGRVID